MDQALFFWASMAAWSFLLMPPRMGMASTRVSTSATAWTAPTPYAPKIQAMGYRMGRKQLPCRAVERASAPLALPRPTQYMLTMATQAWMGRAMAW